MIEKPNLSLDSCEQVTVPKWMVKLASGVITLVFSVLGVFVIWLLVINFNQFSISDQLREVKKTVEQSKEVEKANSK